MYIWFISSLHNHVSQQLLLLMRFLSVCNVFQVDNKGNHLLVHEESSINVPAIAAAHVIKRYIAQASDELSFEVITTETLKRPLIASLKDTEFLWVLEKCYLCRNRCCICATEVLLRGTLSVLLELRLSSQYKNKNVSVCVIMSSYSIMLYSVEYTSPCCSGDWWQGSVIVRPSMLPCVSSHALLLTLKMEWRPLWYGIGTVFMEF